MDWTVGSRKKRWRRALIRRGAQRHMVATEWGLGRSGAQKSSMALDFAGGLTREVINSPTGQMPPLPPGR